MASVILLMEYRMRCLRGRLMEPRPPSLTNVVIWASKSASTYLSPSQPLHGVRSTAEILSFSWWLKEAAAFRDGIIGKQPW